MRSVLLATATPDIQFRCVVENSLRRRAIRFLEDAGYRPIPMEQEVPSVIPKGELIKDLSQLAQLVARPSPPKEDAKLWTYSSKGTTVHTAYADGVRNFFSTDGVMWCLHLTGYEYSTTPWTNADAVPGPIDVKGSDTLTSIRTKVDCWKYRADEFGYGGYFYLSERKLIAVHHFVERCVGAANSHVPDRETTTLFYDDLTEKTFSWLIEAPEGVPLYTGVADWPDGTYGSSTRNVWADLGLLVEYDARGKARSHMGHQEYLASVKDD